MDIVDLMEQMIPPAAEPLEWIAAYAWPKVNSIHLPVNYSHSRLRRLKVPSRQ